MKTLLMCLVVTLLATASRAQSPGFSLATIYYLPFQTETNAPVTQANIKEHANYRFQATDGKSLAALHQILSDGNETTEFDEKRVRLLVVWDNGKQRTVVDAKGDVFDGETQRSLSKADFDKLQTLLSGLVAPKSPPQ